MKEELLKKEMNYILNKSLLNRLLQIEQENNKNLLEEKRKLEEKSKIYKVFRKSKYIMNLEKLKSEIQLNKHYFHNLEEVNIIKIRIVEINKEIETINKQLEQFTSSKRI